MRLPKMRKEVFVKIQTIFLSLTMPPLQTSWIKKRDGTLNRTVHKSTRNKRIKSLQSFLNLNVRPIFTKEAKRRKSWKKKRSGDCSKKERTNKWRTVLFIQKQTANKKIKTYPAKTHFKDSTTMLLRSGIKKKKGWKLYVSRRMKSCLNCPLSLKSTNAVGKFVEWEAMPVCWARMTKSPFRIVNWN